jgi:hypothetical protein
MKWTNLAYQAKVLNRLASLAYRAGGLPVMQAAIERATDKIYKALDNVYGRLPEITRHGYNVRRTI